MLITNDGTLQLWKLDTGYKFVVRLCIIKFCIVYSTIMPHSSLIAAGQDHWWECCYGAHPCQAVIADSSAVNLLDLRVQMSYPNQLITCQFYCITLEFGSAVDTTLFVRQPHNYQGFITTSSPPIPQHDYHFRIFAAAGYTYATSPSRFMICYHIAVFIVAT